MDIYNISTHFFLPTQNILFSLSSHYSKLAKNILSERERGVSAALEEEGGVFHATQVLKLFVKEKKDIPQN